MTTKPKDIKLLSNLKVGEKAIVKRISDAWPQLQRKLLTMGIVAGSCVEFVRTAPLGDPIEVRVLGYNLALRLAEAEMVELK